MIKALIIGFGLLGLLILYAFLGDRGTSTLLTFSGYTGFGLIVISVFMFGSSLGVDRITMATPDVNRNFVADDNNERIQKANSKELNWALYTLLAGVPSVLTWAFMYFVIH